MWVVPWLIFINHPARSPKGDFLRDFIISEVNIMKKIRVSDHSLRSLTASGPLLFREKTAIVASVDNFGADAIELRFAPFQLPHKPAMGLHALPQQVGVIPFKGYFAAQ